jgi:two-component system, LytTR family, response regulator
MKAIIIDDEPHCRNVIERVLEKNCPDIQVIATCANGIEGLKAIIKHQPDIVFLDIEMPLMNGFQMLESLGNEDLHFALIFTTAYDKFAVKAFKFSAFDYLLKPIDDEELIATVQKLERRQTPSVQIQALKQNLRLNTPFNKLTIANTRGIRFIELTDIIALEADGNYTTAHLLTGESVIASKTLGHFADLLSDHSLFFRTHKQFIINLTYIKEYLGGDYSSIVMQNNLQVKLARTRRDAFMELFKL